MPSPADVEVETTETVAAPIAGIFVSTGTAVRVTKVDVANYRHLNLLFRIILIIEIEIPLRDGSTTQVLVLAQSIRTNEFYHKRGIHSITTTVAENRFKVCEGASSATLEFLMKQSTWFYRMGGIGFKRCGNFRRWKTSHWLKLLC